MWIVDGGRWSSCDMMPIVCVAVVVLCCDELDTCDSVLSNTFGDSGRGIALAPDFIAPVDDAEEVLVSTLLPGEALSALCFPLAPPLVPCGTRIGSDAEAPLLCDGGSWDGARRLSSTAARTSA